MTQIPAGYKAGYAAIFGPPNAGKSTLMNALLDIKLSIISDKPQTTRRRVLGILNRDQAQIIFLDTPGLLKPRYKLQEKMMEHVLLALQDADLLLLIIDAKEHPDPAMLNLDHGHWKDKPVLLILNKVDLLPKQQILPVIGLYEQYYPFKAIIPVSALKNDGMDRIEQEMLKHLPQSPPYYPPDILTDHPERFFVSEIVREKIFQRFYEEIPYSTEVIVEEFKEREKGKDYIYAVIMVERFSQKGIIIGKKGEALKRIGAEARRDIETLLDRPVFLELRVKVNENWRKNDTQLRRMGY